MRPISKKRDDSSQEERRQIIEKPFDVWEFSPENLRKALTNEFFTDEEVAEHPQARHIYRYLANPQMDATIILVEWKYTDRHYLDDFADYHVKCHRDYKRVCQRIHFFSVRLPDKAGKKGKPWTEAEFRTALKSMILNGKDETLQEAYLGFVVARPLPVAIIGRTMLKPYPSDGIYQRRKYCITKNGNVNLFGVHLTVESLAYMEQDQTLASCATVALWTCFQKSAEVFHTPPLSPTRITEIGNEGLQIARILPSEGLTIEQVIFAIHRNCLEAEVCRISNKTQLKTILYAYLHYNLPVFLTAKYEKDKHAFAVSGYSLDKEKTRPEPEVPEDGEKQLPYVSSRIDRIYAHDDNRGPYTKFTILRKNEGYKRDERETIGWKKIRIKEDPCENSEYTIWRVPTSKKEIAEEMRKWKPENDEEPIRFVPLVAVIPIYSRIRVSVKTMMTWIEIINPMLRESVERDFPSEMKNLEWDLRLTDQTEWKNDLEEIYGNNVEKIIELRTEWQPKFIWRATLMSGNRCLMDLLADATDIGKSASPFYRVLFYDPLLEEEMSYLYSEENRSKKKKNTSQRQLDEFFYNYFRNYKYHIE